MQRTQNHTMQPILRALGGLLVGLLLLCFIPVAAAGESDAFASVLDARMPGLLNQYHVPGAVVASISDGGVAWTRAYGLADVRTRTPMRPDHVFNFGSCNKILTAWGVMRLVEGGTLDLDAPVDQYLKRWHVPPSTFDARSVTIRRLLSHTAGLSVPAFDRYHPRRSVPTLVQALDGKNQGNGPVTIATPPGTENRYSGGGYGVLQALIEDVSGEPFAGYMRHAIQQPLGMAGYDWSWTPELRAAAATPYGFHFAPLPYYRDAVQAIGSGNGTVTEFARFIAAAVPGPHGEPAGRGVLTPATVHLMMQPQAGIVSSGGLGYGVATMPNGTTQLYHSGHDWGWFALFALDPQHRSGFVIAANADSADPLLWTTYSLWSEAILGMPLDIPRTEYHDTWAFLAPLSLAVAAVLWAAAIFASWRRYRQLRLGRRSWRLRLSGRSFAARAAWLSLAVAWLYLVHTDWPLPVPTTWMEIRWPAEIGWITTAVLAWAILGVVSGLTSMHSATTEARKEGRDDE